MKIAVWALYIFVIAGVWLWIDNKVQARRTEREVEIAREIQRRMTMVDPAAAGEIWDSYVRNEKIQDDRLAALEAELKKLKAPK